MPSEQKWTGTHTPEPWREYESHERIPRVLSGWVTAIHRNMSDTDYDRAVACVNALAGIADPAAELAQLRLDCKALAAEVRLRRATPESSPGEIWEAMEAVDASGALTRHTGDGT